MDPLSVLRTFVMNNQLDQIVESDSAIDFGGLHTFNKNSLTGYKSDTGKGDFYDLDGVLFYVRNWDLSLPDYMKAAKTQEVTQVKFIDQKVRGRLCITYEGLLVTRKQSPGPYMYCY